MELLLLVEMVRGGELNQLKDPCGLSIDNERQSIYIADF